MRRWTAWWIYIELEEGLEKRGFECMRDDGCGTDLSGLGSLLSSFGVWVAYGTIAETS